jgi:hypothetical protein
MRRLALLVLFVACSRPATPKNVQPPQAGVSIAIYEQGGSGYSVVDDRRWIEVAGSAITISNIEPGATLASLVIEPTERALRIGQCVRERLPDLPELDPLAKFAEEQQRLREHALRRRFERELAPRRPFAPALKAEKPEDQGPRYAPVVRCGVDGPPGKHLVRIVYVTPALRYRAHHNLVMTKPDEATVTSRFAVTTPSWRSRADVALFDGVPGGEEAPREIVRGSIELDGTTSVLTAPVQTARAELRRVFDGAVFAGDSEEESREMVWGQESSNNVWVWLELAKLRLAPGPVFATIDLDGNKREADIPPAARKQADEPDAPLRLPLWIDLELRGMRARLVEVNDGSRIVERVTLGIANVGGETREVFVDERARSATKRRIDRVWPKTRKPTAHGDVLRTKLEVKPGRVERTGYTLIYDL